MGDRSVTTSSRRSEKVIFQSVNNHNNIFYANQNEKFAKSFSVIFGRCRSDLGAGVPVCARIGVEQFIM